MKKPIGLFLVSLFSIALTGCAAPTGPLYRDAKATSALNAPPGKALVVIYWVSDRFKGGLSENSNRLNIEVNDRPLEQPMRPGGFYSLLADPGPLKFGASRGFLMGKSAVQTRVSPGRTNFYELTGTEVAGIKIHRVSNDAAEQAIQDCHWLNPSSASP